MAYRVSDKYFEWLYGLVCDDEDKESPITSFMELMKKLHNTDFRFTLPKDANRAHDGVDLRRRFALYHDLTEMECRSLYFKQSCSILEMMIAIAIRCEETIMDDTTKGDRTKQWFWMMIRNLGLNSMTDKLFDEEYVDDVIQRFLDREYKADGKGGLFRIKNCKYDLRDVEIWTQLLWYLDEII